MDFYNKIETGYYMMQDVPYPKAPKKDRVGVASGIYAKQKAKYDAEMVVYRDKQRERKAEFKVEALRYCRLTNHPKAEKAFDYAWEKGHANGYMEVVNELLDLAELLN